MKTKTHRLVLLASAFAGLAGLAHGADDLKAADTVQTSVMRVWDSARESDPFKSIRGDFEFDASDSHHWKTKEAVSGADLCVLIGSSGSGEQEWAYGCRFPAGTEVYQQLVSVAEAVTGSNLVPDDIAQNVNQVHFANPATPSWRLIISRSPTFVSLRIVPDALARLDVSVFFAPPKAEVPAACKEYQDRVKSQIAERERKQVEILMLEAEVGNLQLQYQTASNKYQQAQQAVANANAQANSRTFLGGLSSLIGGLGSLRLDDLRGAVQNAQYQLTAKQNSLNSARTALSMQTSLVPPAGCVVGLARQQGGSNAYGLLA